MRSQIEKNKEILQDEIERYGNSKISDAIATKLSVYRGAYDALCMLESEEYETESEYAYTPAPAKERKERTESEATPDLDGDTEFERVIMAIPVDRAHMIKITHIFDNHLKGLKVVNARAYNSIIEQLKEVARS